MFLLSICACNDTHFFFFFNDTATTEIYTLSLHDALPIFSSASALVEITVSEKGNVDAKNIRVIEDPGHGFAQEAVAVVKKWKFNPATLKDGKPTKTRTTVEVQFTWHSD